MKRKHKPVTSSTTNQTPRTSPYDDDCAVQAAVNALIDSKVWNEGCEERCPPHMKRNQGEANMPEVVISPGQRGRTEGIASRLRAAVSDHPAGHDFPESRAELYNHVDRPTAGCESNGSTSPQRQRYLQRRWEKLQDGLSVHPDRASIGQHIGQLALQLGRTRDGLRVVEAMIDPPQVLYARLLAANGEWRRALWIIEQYLLQCTPAGVVSAHKSPAVLDGPPGERIEPYTGRMDDNRSTFNFGVGSQAAVMKSPDGGPMTPANSSVAASRDIIEAELLRIDLFEKTGCSQRLIQLARIERDDPFASPRIGMRLARAMISSNQPILAVSLARHVASIDRRARLYFLEITLVAAVLSDRYDLAHRCLARLRLNLADAGSGLRMKCAELMDLLRRALTASVIACQVSTSHQAGADPSPGVLSAITRTASERLEAELRRHPDFADLHYHRASCLDRLGRHDLARIHVKNALALNPAYLDAQFLARRLDLDGSQHGSPAQSIPENGMRKV